MIIALYIVAAAFFDVRFTPESRHVRCKKQCLLWARSGHRAASFDHLVGQCQQIGRDFEAECLGSLLVDDKLEFDGL